MLGVERQKQLMGCTDESACLAELTGAVGARFVLSGSVTQLGDVYQLNLQTLDSQKAAPIGRSTKLAKDLASLREQVPFAVAEATATPLPPPPSHLISYSLIGAGGVSLILGGLAGFDALSRDRSLAREFQLGAANPPLPSTRSDYQGQINQIGTERTLSLIGLCAGAAMVATGIFLNPNDASPRSGPVALWSDGRSVGLAGSWR